MLNWLAGKMWERLSHRLQSVIRAEITSYVPMAQSIKQCRGCGMLYVSSGRRRSTNVVSGSQLYDALYQLTWCTNVMQAPNSSDTHCPRCWPAEYKRLEAIEWAKANPDEASKCRDGCKHKRGKRK